MNNIQVVWLKSTHCHFCKEKSLPKQEKSQKRFHKHCLFDGDNGIDNGCNFVNNNSVLPKRFYKFWKHIMLERLTVFCFRVCSYMLFDFCKSFFYYFDFYI